MATRIQVFLIVAILWCAYEMLVCSYYLMKIETRLYAIELLSCEKLGADSCEALL